MWEKSLYFSPVKNRFWGKKYGKKGKKDVKESRVEVK